MTELVICCPSTGNHEAAAKSWEQTMSRPWSIIINSTITGENAGYVKKVQGCYEMISDGPEVILAYFHSDLIIHEKDWDTRVLKEFLDPSVAIVSFFGARTLGRADLYKVPYHSHQLARGDCWSNMRDAEAHGCRCTNAMDVAMIDSFSLIVRKSFLDEIGGFPMFFPPSHGIDMYLCMMAARLKKRVRLVGVDCTHTSGGVRGDGKFDYPTWAANTEWGSDAAMHYWVHRYLYNEFKDVLPIRR